jgi:hypothetical protein
MINLHRNFYVRFCVVRLLEEKNQVQIASIFFSLCVDISSCNAKCVHGIQKKKKKGAGRNYELYQGREKIRVFIKFGLLHTQIEDKRCC